MTACPFCKSNNVIRLNPQEKVPQYKCLREGCKRFFIEQRDRIALLIAINKDKPDLRDLDNHGAINERLFEFWARTNPTFAKYYRAMLEETDNLLEMLTPATTIEKDARRDFDGNEDGLNKTYRLEARPLERLTESQ